MKYVAGVDVGGTNIKLGMVDEEGMVLCRDNIPAKTRESFQEFAEPIAQSLTDLQAQVGGRLKAIGIGTPGFTNKQTGILLEAAELVPYLKGNSLAQFLGEKLRVEAFADNDGTCAAAGEWKWGSGKAYRNFLLITLGTGIGGGLVLDGKLYRGSQGFAGEVGHLCVDPNGSWCVCGSRGCLEQYASATAILRLYREKRQKRGLVGQQAMSPKAVFDAAGAGDPLAVETLREGARAIAQIFGSATNLLNLDACILGGGLSLAGDQLAELVRPQVVDYAWPLLAQNLQIRTAELKNDAGLLGAAALAFEELQR